MYVTHLLVHHNIVGYVNQYVRSVEVDFCINDLMFKLWTGDSRRYIGLDSHAQTPQSIVVLRDARYSKNAHTHRGMQEKLEENCNFTM